jgi:hypothetical protein
MLYVASSTISQSIAVRGFIFPQFASVLRVFSSFGSPPVRHERFSGSRFFSFPFFF